MRKKLCLAGLLMMLVPQAFAKPAPEFIVLGMGCFWGAEKRMSELKGVLDVESGYAGGVSDNATYESVIKASRMEKWGMGTKDHAEVVKVTYDVNRVDAVAVLKQFWESHNPTEGDRQGNDIGSQYRSAVYYRTEEQRDAVYTTMDEYQALLTKAGFGDITTEVKPLGKYFTAEEYHQNYLNKNPNGYCGLGGVGVKFPKK